LFTLIKSLHNKQVYNLTFNLNNSLELVQIVDKNSVESRFSEEKEMCIELSYDIINKNYLSFDING